LEIALVFGRMFLSSASNVFQKQLSHRGLHPFYIVAATYAVLSVLAAACLGKVTVSHLSDAFWVNVFLASLLDVGGWMFMVMSLSQTDLSVFGPLNAYKVVISMVLALVFLGELPLVDFGFTVGLAGECAAENGRADRKCKKITTAYFIDGGSWRDGIRHAVSDAGVVVENADRVYAGLVSARHVAAGISRPSHL
jgi:uncharacterized membrane protein